ncbi:MAG: hypothetical protein ACYSTL_01590, partial [Planctomycetota bacterium]
MGSAGAMTFRRIGRSYHLRIETAADLQRVVDLDEAHWVATSAPIDAINCDKTFLQLLDADASGRITAGELSDAIRWLCGVLRERSGITERSDTVLLEAIDPDCDDGRKALNAAEKILIRHRGDEGQITLEQVRQVKAEARNTPVSEGGLVLPEAAEDEQIRAFVSDVIAVTGGQPYPGGECGVTAGQIEEFISAAEAQLEWREAGELSPGEERTDFFPLGPETQGAYELLIAVRGKLDQYFAHCEAAALDERFAEQMHWKEGELEALDFDDPNAIEEVLASAPIARSCGGRELRFDGPLNPHYAELLARFNSEVVEPVLHRSGNTLSSGEWRRIKSAFAAYREYVESEPAAKLAALGDEKLRTYLDKRYADSVRALIAAGAAAALDLDNIRLLEKIILYQ